MTTTGELRTKYCSNLAPHFGLADNACIPRCPITGVPSANSMIWLRITHLVAGADIPATQEFSVGLRRQGRFSRQESVT